VSVGLDLRHFYGTTPVELIGGRAFPRIGEHPYGLSLEPYGFYWFRLVGETGAWGKGG